jgi:hypothetical protein
MIELFALACTLSRVSSSLAEKGAEGAAREIEIVKVFANQVERRVRHNFGLIDINDDELLKGLADFAFEQEKFGWDNL